MGGAVSFGFGGSSSKGSGERRGSGSGPQQLKQLMRSASSRKGFAEALSPEPRLSSDKVEQALLQSTRKRMSESTRNLLQAHSDDEGFIERNAVLAAAAGRRPSWRPSPKSSESPGQSPRGSLADCMQVLRSPRAVEEHKDASPRENDRENEDPRRRSADSSDIAVVVDEAPAKRVPGPSSTPRRRSFVSMGVGEGPRDPEPASPVRDEDLFEPGDRVEDRYVGDVDPVYVEKFVGKGSFGSVFVVRVGDLALEYDVRLAGRRLLRNVPGDALAARSSSPPPEKRPSEKKQRVNYLSATGLGTADGDDGAPDAAERLAKGQALLESATLQLYCGLDHMHRHGVMHQDIKPANVMIRRDGLVQITDLGLSSRTFWTDSDPHTTYKGRTLAAKFMGGSRAYMSPEQRRIFDASRRGPPKPRSLSRRLDASGAAPPAGSLITPATSDLWAAAVVVLEMFAQCQPDQYWGPVDDSRPGALERHAREPRRPRGRARLGRAEVAAWARGALSEPVAAAISRARRVAAL
ncbi:serine/threonine kinase [Aureococcus anophagefferens]|nr:serine/threonine kinase [Aureococcus anophagefferens]